MKKNICRVISCCLLIITLFLTGCGGFIAEDDLMIASIESQLMHDGRTKITITYTDETVDPYEFFIPKGEVGADGKEGNGIKEIVYNHDKQNRQTSVVISFTDEKLAPVVFDIPDGLSVVGMEDGIDEISKEKYIVFKYSDNSISDQIFLPKGDTGNGIKDYTQTVNEDKSITLDFLLDDGRTINIFIPPPQNGENGEDGKDGKDGTGIESMVSGVTDEGMYYIDVKYTDKEEPERLEFGRPIKWHNLDSEPTSNIGENGDFCFDTKHRKIYEKKNGQWELTVDFKIEKYTVKFDLNDDDESGIDAEMPEGANTMYRVERGSYFSADGNGDIPIPTRDGYKFKGWYSKKAVNSTTMSPFTDFTPVFSDLTLYANWEKK